MSRSSTAIAVASLSTVAIAAAAVFARLNLASARRETAPIDEPVERAAAAPPGHPARESAEQIAPLGKWYVYVPAAVGFAGAVLLVPHEDDELASRAGGAAAIVLAASAAALLNEKFDDWLPQPTPPPGRPPDKPVFPSGHAFGPASVCLTAAYVAIREELAPSMLAIPLALLIPAATAGGRMLEEKHWLSDIIGGYLGALAVASTSAVLYEVARRESGERGPGRMSS